MKLLQLIRFKNLLLIALVQLLIKYALFPSLSMNINGNELFVSTSLTHFEFLLLMLSTLCIAAGGYIINDIYDIEADAINKPDKQIIGKAITEEKGYNFYMAFTVVGVILGFYLSNLVGESRFFGIFVIIAALLYIYATFLQRMLLVGNIVISMLVGLSLIIVGIFELLPAITLENSFLQTSMFEVLFDYAVFAFIITLIREIVKDIQDVDGDYKAQLKTLPIVIGKNRAAKTAFGLTILAILLLVYYLVSFLYMQQIVVIYFLITVIAPLIYIAIKLFTAEHKKEFQTISNLLKLVMLSGMLSMVVYLVIK
ncbi:geranylgeranylglycerol-phosphate geranylgeranyltransferase [Olleya sp. HaHaR_3_96]|uniref:geranylgeranylglycerol-phosphate geranylgeranyltransferase n=1 Tax=Olleya sp. HaHaR_3_96 TaxID=2745560 RepID=UPI001C4EDFD9|nr:geranylgeranylglycerol-phosphate geranylgeranyltransferase [Olleya sp. HaHaR_3_96]QXP59504.1 geranylgeranylglycerol-phosphate geranylgeranyltransferase [Olleya sp. HaHaR_3_96]